MLSTRKHGVDCVWKSLSTPNGIWATRQMIMPGMASTEKYGVHSSFWQTDVNWTNAANNSCSLPIQRRQRSSDRRPNPNLRSPAVRLNQAAVKIRSRTRALAKREATATSLRSAVEIDAPAVGRHSTTTNEEDMCRVHPWGSMRSITLLPRAICTTTCTNSTSFSRRNRML
jgi:hypothetical protein